MNPKNEKLRHGAAHACMAVATVLVASGCASFSPDGGFDNVAALVRERTGQTTRWQRSDQETETLAGRVDELLAAPLGVEGAVEIALSNNHGLQADYAELGIAEADLVRAGRLANPSIGFSHISGGGITEIDRSFTLNLIGLLTMPTARRVEQSRFEQAQFRAAYDAVGVAAQTRRAFFSAVAAQDQLKYYQQVKDAAEASNVLAQRMAAAGNFNALSQMRQQAFFQDATSMLDRAAQRALAERERLTRLLGLSGARREFSLPERLPDLPVAAIEPQNAEQTAMDKRLDVLLVRRASQATARQLGLVNATRFINVLDAGFADKNQTGEARRDGYTIELELPLFDFGAARTTRAEAIYRRSLQQAAEVAVTAQSEVRESWSAYRTAYELARHFRDDVVPLRQRISDENMLRYNGMLISVFELLADSREQVSSVTAYIDALRDFWIADTDLQTTSTGRSTMKDAR